MFRIALLIISLTTAISSVSRADSQSLIVSEICIQQFGKSWGMLGSIVSCEQIRSTEETMSLLNVALVPASIAFNSPLVQKALSLEMAALGLTMTNPMVVSATVIGATGITVLHYLLRLESEECQRLDQEKLRQSIIDELNRTNLINKKS